MAMPPGPRPPPAGGMPPGATPVPAPPPPGLDPSAPGAAMLQQALQGLNPQQQQVLMAVMGDPVLMETVLQLAAAGAVAMGGQGGPPGAGPPGPPDQNAMFGPPPGAGGPPPGMPPGPPMRR